MKEVTITLLSSADSYARSRFFVDWVDRGRKRGQIFNADLKPYLARFKAEGARVTVVEAFEQW